MPAVEVRSTFGHAAVSLEAARASLAVARPISLVRLSELYAADMVFDEPIVTGDGVALGGHHRLTVRRDGSFRYQGQFEAKGVPSYEVAILTTLGYTVPLPDGQPPAGAQVAFAAHGTVHGSVDPGDAVYRWDSAGASSLLASEWQGVRQAHLNHHLEYDADWFGPAGDVVSFVAQVVAFGATLGAAGVAIVMVGEAADLLDIEELVLPGMVGVLMAGGAAFVFGPIAMLPAFIVGAVVTAELIEQRHLETWEQDFADRVFRGKLPFDRVLLTNLVGLGHRPFTCPGPGGTILLNLGSGYRHPTEYTGNGGAEQGLNAPGGLLIHELTHAWQIANESFTPEYYCRALSTAAATAGGDMSKYAYGPPGGAWSSFGTEQQASIVEHWFAGPGAKDEKNRQWKDLPGLDDEETPPPQNPYYRYIRDNIRSGVA